MANMCNIDSDKIKSTSASMEKEIANVRTCAQKFTDAIMALDKQWVSESKALVMDSYQTDLEALHEVADQMAEFCQLLTGMANSYDQSESDIADKIKNLPKF